MFFKMGVLKYFSIYTRRHQYWSLFNKFIKKEAATQVFSCKYYEIFKDSFFTEHLEWLFLHIYKDIAKALRKTRSFF